MEFKESVEAGCENVKITNKMNVDMYVGKVVETDGILVVIKSIDKFAIKNGHLTLDVTVMPIHKIR
jgi:hypothetical protein